MREPTNRSDSFKGKRLATEPLLSQCDITDIICPNPGANAGLNLRVRFMVQQHGGSFRCTSMSSFRARCGLCCQGSPIRSGFAWRRLPLPEAKATSHVTYGEAMRGVVATIIVGVQS
jgi:hypothetical protein